MGRWVDLEMRRYIILLLTTGIVWAQTDFDKLVLKDKTVYTGTLIKFDDDEIIFKALPSAKMSISIKDIKELKLSDGRSVIENGVILANNEKHIKSIRDGNYLSTIQAEKAKKKSNSTIQELFIKNMKDNGYKKRKSEIQKPMKNSTLTLKDKSIYSGALVKYVNDKIILKVLLTPGALPSTVSLVSSRPTKVPLNSSRMFSAKLSINISDIQELKLSDGTKVFENGILIEPEEQLRKYIKMGNMKENSKYIINCCILILILGYIALLSTDIDLGGTSGPWPGDGATMDS
tara:strand:- start:2356 stop:3225 length:870 start_codon:yes stop_codon:yes gene_type:complete